MADAFSVTSLDDDGYGVAFAADGSRVRISGAVPGDVVTGLVLDGIVDTPVFVSRSMDWLEPPCADYGRCGGCQAQHMSPTLYNAWKTGLLGAALAEQSIDCEIGALVQGVPASRRRAAFSLRHTEQGAEIGFQEARSHRIVVFAECHVIVPVLNKARGALKALARAALPLMAGDAKPATALVTVTKSGLDVAMSNVERINSDRREAALQVALKANFARLSINGELVVETRKPVLLFDGLAVTPPVGGFTQAVEAIEVAMRKLIASHLAGSKRVVDLFAGCGSFSLPLARAHSVHAVEMDKAALEALDVSWRQATGMKAVTTEPRNLFERPLTADELQAFDGLVFDPPRAGASNQAKEIAKSGVEKVAAVSCNPKTLARDLRTLIDGGYQVKSVTPLDQFLWTTHLEAVALLEKPKAKKPRSARLDW